MMPDVKPIQERLEECVAMRMWMRSVQIDHEPECKDLHDRISRFAKSGEPSSGSLFVPKINRRVVYMLSNRADSNIGFFKKK